MSDTTYVDKSGRERQRKTHCKSGHLYTVENTAWKINWKGYRCRNCRECARLLMAQKRVDPERKRTDREKTARWRAKDPKRARASWKRAYEKRNSWIQDFKKQCKYCSETRVPCLDFHHRDSHEKLGTIGAIRHWPRKRLAEEIAKCDIVCASCHRWLHWEAHKNNQVLEGV
jgi:hypothetical protein